MKHIPLYPLLFTIYPALAMAGHNLGEIDPVVAIRPLLVSLLSGLLVFLVGRWVLKDWERAAAVSTFSMVLFYSYGHVYYFLEAHPIGNLNLGRHRILIGVFAVVLMIGLWNLVRNVKNLTSLTPALNLASLVMLVVPLYQFGKYLHQATPAILTANAANQAPAMLTPGDTDSLPDIYYIILDTYTRGDALENEFGFDNSGFLDRLRRMGFYVADCSRSNYEHTQQSVTSSLNMAYVSELSTRLDELGLDPTDIVPTLKQSQVRQQLEAIGYQTVAFETGYDWSSFTDADIYLRIGSDPLALQQFTPFEAMYFKTTALLILADSQSTLLQAQFSDVNFPYHEFIDRQRFILDQLPQIATQPGAKFVFVHILIPHIPYVFTPNGSIQTDPGFYNGWNGNPGDEQHFVEGYTNMIQYINGQIVPIIQHILDTSQVPPIIILMGDHGVRDANRLQILNAFYLPKNGASQLYPSITPVNTFRVIFNAFFGTDYEPHPDLSYSNNGDVMPETSPACLAP